MLIQSRSVNGGVTASVAFLSGVINADGINRSYEAYTTGGGYLVSVFTVGGGQVALSTTAATFDVTISFPAT